MAVYKYVGRNKQGKSKRGIIEASNERQAILKLREDGVILREIREVSGILYKEITFGPQVKNEHFVIFCRQFATLLRAGISIVDATNILAKQTESKNLKKILNRIEEDLRTGISFSAAASKYPKVFSPLFINMVQAGETIGNLDDTLDRLATYLEKQFTLEKKVKSALAYPAMLLIFSLMVVAFLMIFVVPTFTNMTIQMGGELPGTHGASNGKFQYNGHQLQPALSLHLKLNSSEVHLIFEINLKSIGISIFSENQPEFFRYITLDIADNDWEVRLSETGFLSWSFMGEKNRQLGLIEDQLTELDRIMNFYRFSVHKGNQAVSQIIICGDFPNLNLIKEKLESQYQLPIIIIDEYHAPKKHFHADRTFIPVLGLALKGEAK